MDRKHECLTRKAASLTTQLTTLLPGRGREECKAPYQCPPGGAPTPRAQAPRQGSLGLISHGEHSRGGPAGAGPDLFVPGRTGTRCPHAGNIDLPELLSTAQKGPDQLQLKGRHLPLLKSSLSVLALLRVTFDTCRHGAASAHVLHVTHVQLIPNKAPCPRVRWWPPRLPLTPGKKGPSCPVVGVLGGEATCPLNPLRPSAAPQALGKSCGESTSLAPQEGAQLERTD